MVGGLVGVEHKYDLHGGLEGVVGGLADVGTRTLSLLDSRVSLEA